MSPILDPTWAYVDVNTGYHIPTDFIAISSASKRRVNTFILNICRLFVRFLTTCVTQYGRDTGGVRNEINQISRKFIIIELKINVQ